MSSTLPQLIDGEWRQSQSRDTIDVTDPATQAVIARAPKATPEEIEAAVEGVRIYAGYSGWSVGQLDGEIERDDWIVLSALPSDVLVEPRVDLWSRVLRRQPMPMAMLATHPIDVSRN